jgi:prolyl-tRNA editing enzyme YbaK/EbsC (Cys-tRNA(Pro) deacylase)
LRPSQIRYAALDALAPRLALGAMLESRAARMFARDVSAACRPWTRIHALHEKEKETSEKGKETSSPLRPLTDADVRAALAKLGALRTDDEKTESASSLSLALITGWRAKTQAPLSASPADDASVGTSNVFFNKRQTPLLCKTLAVVAERVGDGGVELAATCVLPARDDVRLDLDAAAVALGIFAEDDANVFSESSNVFSSSRDDVVGASTKKKRLRLRLANETELHRLFGFATGSVGPFGLRDLRKAALIEAETEAESRATKKAVLKTVLGSVKRAAVVDESLFAHDAIAVGGGAPDVKVVGTARAVATRADARVARITQTTP